MNAAAGVHPPLAMPASTRDGVLTSAWIEKPPLESRLRREGPFFVIAAGVVAMSFLLPTLQSRHAWINIPCIFHVVTGVPCLACGLTRSFVNTAHGNFLRAFDFHLLGPALFVMFCGLAAYFGSSLVLGYRVRYRLSPRARRIASWSVLGIFLVCWGIKIAFMKGGW